MADMVTIDGTGVDLDDPCAIVRALRKVELKLATGAAVVMTRFDDEEVRWSAARLNDLRDLIAKYERDCEIKSGRSYRRARRMRFVR